MRKHPYLIYVKTYYLRILVLFSKSINVYTVISLNGQMHRSWEMMGVSVLL